MNEARYSRPDPRVPRPRRPSVRGQRGERQGPLRAPAEAQGNVQISDTNKKNAARPGGVFHAPSASPASPNKSFLPRFFTKKRAGSRGGAPAARRSARNPPIAKKRRRGSKGEPSPGVPPLRAAPAARSLAQHRSVGSPRTPCSGQRPQLHRFQKRHPAPGRRGVLNKRVS